MHTDLSVKDEYNKTERQFSVFDIQKCLHIKLITNNTNIECHSLSVK